MRQLSFSDAEYAGTRKKTRREVFLEEMELVVPWKVLLKLIEPHYPGPVGKHPFRVIKRQFGLLKVRLRGLAKNTAHVTLFALSNLWMVRKQLLTATGAVRSRTA